jgi:hypothetical protein
MRLTLRVIRGVLRHGPSLVMACPQGQRYRRSAVSELNHAEG